MLYDKDQSTLNLLWLSCSQTKIYCLDAATAYGFVSPWVQRYAESVHRVPSRRVSLLFCNRLLWHLQRHLKPSERKGISWVQRKFCKWVRVVLLKARKQVHTMSFLSGQTVSMGSQTRAAPLLINSVSRSTISCSLTPSCIFLLSGAHYSDSIIVSKREGCWKKRPEQDPAFPTSPKLAFLLERNQTSILHFLGKINVIQA